MAVLFTIVLLAVVVGIFARRDVAAVWPPAGRLFGEIGLDVAPSGSGLTIEKIVPTRTAGGLIINGEIANLGDISEDVPRLRVVLQNAGDQDLQSEIVAPPKARLRPGETAQFATPFADPADAATSVVVTFVSR
ncbi:MAG TPA: DUF3426 domain-containing protein [Stellaceae bacterium]|nr:DUF3426 domain-containing protein [Stellaceae bacterium]